jgi:hypothetical protein
MIGSSSSSSLSIKKDSPRRRRRRILFRTKTTTTPINTKPRVRRIMTVLQWFMAVLVAVWTMIVPVGYYLQHLQIPSSNDRTTTTTTTTTITGTGPTLLQKAVSTGRNYTLASSASPAAVASSSSKVQSSYSSWQIVVVPLSTNTTTTTTAASNDNNAWKNDDPNNNQHKTFNNNNNRKPVVVPNGRHEACFVMVHNNKAYLIGGRGRRLPVNEYNVDQQQWTRKHAKLSKQQGDVHHAQCLEYKNDGNIWIVSSWTGGYPNEYNNDKILIYNPIQDTWNTTISISNTLAPERHRGATAAAVYQDEIYISHGASGTFYLFISILSYTTIFVE